MDIITCEQPLLSQRQSDKTTANYESFHGFSIRITLFERVSQALGRQICGSKGANTKA
jgi:hypothetical protein